ncbi:Protein of unknown function [Blastococcus aggregatus]|uniref:DUF2695 domain-containing protein n=1 Tax=Blastococcus aggregatus TaxID=38502 RepID=A0A285V802_9ACTN|nr:DUF2695 domain-containing protein [Blastococcus aggregatus]SOC50244.1 Protein of unknown function [Blastococcus aggregatus]
MANENQKDHPAVRAARMPLDAAQLEELLDHVDDAVLTDGCDHTLNATEAWARRRGLDVERLRQALQRYGGFCDCEVLMNVDADEVLTLPRQPGRS